MHLAGVTLDLSMWPAPHVLLPKTDDYVRRLKMIENEIAEMGGEAVTIEAAALDRGQAETRVSSCSAVILRASSPVALVPSVKFTPECAALPVMSSGR